MPRPDPNLHIAPSGSAAVGVVHHWRTDIQALRGLAVLLVVLEHAHFPGLPGGFLGVDIFFVISGYLMTRIIRDELASGNFRFRHFYARRARRLLPAAYATILVTALASNWLLDPIELRHFFWQMAGAFVFLANIVLWSQTDYFGSGAALKPLLHLWSLSIEEQYFLGLPLLLVLLRRTWHTPALLALVAVSLVLCLTIGQRSPSANFYFLPTRGWELGLGSLVALLNVPTSRIPARKVGRWLSAGLLVGLPVLVTELGHPGWPALIICLATAFLLASGEEKPLPPIFRPLILAGDRSYSLYLVHWPIFALLNNVFIGPAPPFWNALGFFASLMLAEAQFRAVERPFRRMEIRPASLAVLVAIPMLATLAVAASVAQLSPERLAERQSNYGLGRACISNRSYSPQEACRTGAQPELLFWGDSVAMHLGPALAHPGGIAVEQATLEVCGPFLGLAPIKGAQHGPEWARTCIGFNEAVLRHLAQSPSIRTVVLSSALVQYLPERDGKPARGLVEQDGARVERDLSEELLIEALARTVEGIRKLGRKVVLVMPPPTLGIDHGRCLSRIRQGLPTQSSSPDCSFTLAEAERERPQIARIRAMLEAHGQVPISSFDALLCPEGRCQPTLENVPVFIDDLHFSRGASRKIGERLDFARLMQRLAR